MGLVAMAAELASDGLAAKLNVQGLLNGTTCCGSTARHTQNSANWTNLMYSQNNSGTYKSWNRVNHGFTGSEKTYLDRILP